MPAASFPIRAGAGCTAGRCGRSRKLHLKHSPQRYLDRLRYDTITHAKAPLEFLIGSAGADRVFLGSDYPYDMGTGECVRQVKAANISAADRDKILGGHAAAILSKKRAHAAA